MEYQIYEILLIFSICSILGWMAVGFGFALNGGGFQNRGICRGPYLISFGLGALLIIGGMELFERKTDYQVPEPILAFLLGILSGLVLGFLAKVIVDGLCGEKLVRWQWFHPLLCGLGAVILVLHLAPILIAYIRWMSPWVHLVFLLVYWMKFISDLIEGISALHKFKRKSTFYQSAE